MWSILRHGIAAAKPLPVKRISFLSDYVHCLSRKQSSDANANNDDNPVRQLLKTSASSPHQKEAPEFPSDVSDDYAEFREFNKSYRSQSRHRPRTKHDAVETSVLLFPGQGSQFVGMGRDLLQYAYVQEMYDVASGILGYNLLDICLNGPIDMLNKTIHCQPAVVVTALAAVEALRSTNKKAIDSCVSTAGYSVGEIAALIFADAISFEDGVRLVKKRAELMQQASEAVPSGMMTVVLRADARLKYALHTARLYCLKQIGIEDPVCDAAIHLYPEVKVIAGHNQALDFIEENRRDFGIARCHRLPVSGAFHTSLMTSAKSEYLTMLHEIDIRTPIITVFANVTSHRHTRDKIRMLLLKQLYAPVKWEQTMHVMFSRPKGEAFPQTYELGPGKQLGAILKKTNSQAYDGYKAVNV